MVSKSPSVELNSQSGPTFCSMPVGNDFYWWTIGLCVCVLPTLSYSLEAMSLAKPGAKLAKRKTQIFLCSQQDPPPPPLRLQACVPMPHILYVCWGFELGSLCLCNKHFYPLILLCSPENFFFLKKMESVFRVIDHTYGQQFVLVWKQTL